jgi:hypothetical protein
MSVTERPATRADLRAVAWLYLRWGPYPGERALIGCGLRMLAMLDADERDDPAAAALVASWLRRGIVETSPKGRPVTLRWRDPVPAP